jgi:hypothetical protein
MRETPSKMDAQRLTEPRIQGQEVLSYFAGQQAISFPLSAVGWLKADS